MQTIMTCNTIWLVYHDKVASDDLNWNRIIFQYSEQLLKYVLNTFSNTVPSPDNMRRWKRTGNHFCGLCGKGNATLAHILAGCNWVRFSENKMFREDRYTWRHNSMLQTFINAIGPHIHTANTQTENTHTYDDPHF